MRKYTGDWKDEDKPKWSIRSKRIARGYESRMSTSSTPFVWVEAGTRKRWRAMSSDWQSKTRPGSLKTRPGRGRAAGFFRSPRPGIKARNNLETLAEMRKQIFALEAQARINAAAHLLFKD